MEFQKGPQIAFFLALLICGLAHADDHDHANDHDNHEHGPGFNHGKPMTELDKTLAELYTSCDEKKTHCVGMPVGCVGTHNCSFVASSFNHHLNKKYIFTMMGNFENSQVSRPYYVALGIAEDGRGMANATVISCSTTKVDVFWSPGTTSPHYILVPTYFQAKQHTPADGTILCKFLLDATFSEHDHKFDLDNKQYALLLARGQVKSDDHGTPGYHGQKETDKHLFEPANLSKSSSLFTPSTVVTISLALSLAIILKA